MIIRDLIGYKVSRDYARLAEISKNSSVICFVDFDEMRDVAQTIYEGCENKDSWYVSVRGTCYIHAFELEKFIARCHKLNLEFIEPNSDDVAQNQN